MPKIKEAIKLEASEKQIEIIETMTKATHLEKHYIDRAIIILSATQNLANNFIANKLKIERNTVKLWRKRWSENQAILNQVEKDSPKQLENAIKEVLDDAKRKGRNPTFTQEQVAAIIAISLQTPESLEIPISNWTYSDIADTAAKLGIVESISESQVGRFLKYKGNKNSSI